MFSANPSIDTKIKTAAAANYDYGIQNYNELFFANNDLPKLMGFSASSDITKSLSKNYNQHMNKKSESLELNKHYLKDDGQLHINIFLF